MPASGCVGFARASVGNDRSERLEYFETELSDQLAARPQDQPAAAELEHVLAEDLARAAIADVVVERPARVGDLAPAVAALHGPEERPLYARADAELPLRRVVRGPGLRAGPVAGTAPMVARERVENVAATIVERLSVAGRVRCQRGGGDHREEQAHAPAVSGAARTLRPVFPARKALELVEGVRRLDPADRAGPRAHDDRVGDRALGRVAHAA